MATAKKTAKKTTSKRATAKKAPRKKASAKRTAPQLSDDAKVGVVKDSGVPKMPGRRKVRDAVPAAGVKVAALREKTGCTLDTVRAMIAKGFLEVL